MLNWLKSEYIVYVLCNQSVFHLILDIKKCMYTSVHSKDAITGKKSKNIRIYTKQNIFSDQ